MIAGGAEATMLLTQADSARAVATVYTLSVLATVPLVIVAIAAFFLRRASAEARSLIWRSAIVALLIVFIGRQLPLQWIAWVVPWALARPLVVLGRVQVTGSTLAGPGSGADPIAWSAMVRGMFFVYLAGVAVVLIPTGVGLARGLARLATAAGPADRLVEQR